MSAHGSNDTIRPPGSNIQDSPPQGDDYIPFPPGPSYDIDKNDPVHRAFLRLDAGATSVEGLTFEKDTTIKATALTANDFRTYSKRAEKAYKLVFGSYESLHKYQGTKENPWKSLGVLTIVQCELEGFLLRTTSRAEAYQRQISNRNDIFKRLRSDADGVLAEFAQYSQYMKDKSNLSADKQLNYKDWLSGYQSKQIVRRANPNRCVPLLDGSKEASADSLAKGECAVYSDLLLRTWVTHRLCASQLEWLKEQGPKTISGTTLSQLKETVSGSSRACEEAMNCAGEVVKVSDDSGAPDVKH